jgi:GxxExxY protein
MDLEELARISVNCRFQLHKELGPGLLESMYEVLMFESLREAGVAAERQVQIPIKYKGIVVDNAFRIDLLLEGQLPIELKSTEQQSALHAKQLLTFFRLMNLPLGLLMNFGQETFKQGVRRIANNYKEPAC